LSDGGWNCDAPRSQRSSFHTSICVLEGLLEYEKAKGQRNTLRRYAPLAAQLATLAASHDDLEELDIAVLGHELATCRRTLRPPAACFRRVSR
jgi:hypothetical protein